jgi:hypothetical protein
MLSVLARRIAQPPVGTHPALWSFAEECRGVFAGLLAYVGILGLIAIVGACLWAELPSPGALEPAAKVGWIVAERSYPAFAISQANSAGKLESYEILRHPDGGRRDVLRWAASALEKPTAELELYRPGGEFSRQGLPVEEVAARMDRGVMREISGEGVIDSKFGPLALFGFGPEDDRRCLGFVKNLAAANLRISGWSCQAETVPARRLSIACTLNRLILLTAANDPKLAELFARAELKRGSCAAAGGAALSADWVTGAQNPRLRGSL